MSYEEQIKIILIITMTVIDFRACLPTRQYLDNPKITAFFESIEEEAVIYDALVMNVRFIIE